MGLHGPGSHAGRTARGPGRLPAQRRAAGAGQAGLPGAALPARAPRRGDHRRRHRRAEQRGLGAGREPAARPEGPAGLADRADMTTVTKTARHARIAAILAREQVRSQEELADLLERYARVHVTQATLSRDLDELGVVRLRAAGGGLVYALPEEPGGPGSRPGSGLADRAEDIASGGQAGSSTRTTTAEAAPPARLARYLSELLTSAEASANLVVLRTPAG